MISHVAVNNSHTEKITFFDKVLAKSVLPFIPKFVTPNQVTTFRYLTVPVILYSIFYGYYHLGIILFSISSFSDAVDGALARTRNMVTEWGKMHDPLADKLLIGTVGAVVVSTYISIYIMTIIIVIELFLILSSFMRLRKGGKITGALLPGKIKMISFSFGVALVLLYIVFPLTWFLTLASTLLYLGIFFALISLIVYSSV